MDFCTLSAPFRVAFRIIQVNVNKEQRSTLEMRTVGFAETHVGFQGFVYCCGAP